MNWMRLKSDSSVLGQALDGACLGEARQAFDQNVAVGEQRDDEALDDALLADDVLVDAPLEVEDALPRVGFDAAVHGPA